MANTTRPTRNAIDSGLAAWDADVEANDAIILDDPFPIPEQDDADDEADVAADFPVAQFGNCMRRVQHSGLQDKWLTLITEGNTRWQALAQDLRCPFRSVTGTPTTLNAEDTMVLCNSGSAQTVNLASAATCAGRTITVKQLGAGNVTLDGNASETIDGATTYALTAAFQSVSVYSDGSNWHVVAKVV